MTRYPATKIAGVAAFLFLACGAALAQSAPDAPASSIKLTRVVIALPSGTQWAEVNSGFLCVTPRGNLNATGGRENQDLPPYAAAFKTALEGAGYHVIASDDDLFSGERRASDYQVAAVITDAHIDACLGEDFYGKLDGDARGSGMLKIDWQVYSPIKNQVVANVSTSGNVKIDKSVPGGFIRLLTDSFANAAQQLSANAEFRAAVSAKPPAAQDLVQKEQQSKIALLGNSKAPTQSIADATGSVVTILTGSVSGSGVLVSDDGYIITNAHVVGDEKELRVRWSDGIEKVGQVIRISKPRDVALVKTDPRERQPLPILRGAVTPGDKVYAIGSPRGKEFSGTVSSGVISTSNRTIEGMRYIQSDVSISPGSSGGALLDEKGSLIGITVSTVENEGQRAGLNLFIPIGDAMDFLSLERN